MFFLGGQKTMKERFDANEECRALCLDKICVEFKLALDEERIIRSITNFLDTFHYFKIKGLSVEGYIDKRLLASPKQLINLHRIHGTSSKSFFERTDINKHIVYMYYSSAYESMVSRRIGHIVYVKYITIILVQFMIVTGTLL